MNILAISDLHLGKTGVEQGIDWTTFFVEVLQRAHQMARTRDYDVLYFGGDAAEKADTRDPASNLKEAIRLLSEIPIAQKLWVMGNNDLECLSGPLDTYSEEMQGLLGDRFHLLDAAPFQAGKVGFFGNIGGHNGSLWKPPAVSEPEVIALEEEMIREDEIGWAAHFGPRADLGPRQFYLMAQGRMLAHYRLLADMDQLVMGTHFVPSPDFVLYGQSPKYDWLNWFMGYDAMSLPLPFW